MTTAITTTLSPEDQRRFWSHVDKTSSDCWRWQGVTRNEYGRFKVHGRYYSAHRLAYELLVGEIPAHLTLDHSVGCNDRSCVNPSHVEVVTRSENTARSNVARGWPCDHAKIPSNIYSHPRGGEQCRTCRRESNRRRRLRKRGG